MTRPDPGAFWEFSLAFYSRESVSAACLSLQDRRGADVNILLLCCWLATLGYRTEEVALSAAIAAVEPWRREVLEPLRAARGALAERFPGLAKSARHAIKHGILAVELECERAAQEQIVAAISSVLTEPDAAPTRGIANAALEVYLGMVIDAPDSRDAEDVAALLDPL